MAKVVHGRVARDYHGAGLGIDLDFGDMAAVRIGDAVDPIGCGIERMRLGHGEGASEFDKADRVPPRVEFPLRIAEAAFGNAELRRGVGAPEFDEFFTEDAKRAAGAQHAARAAGAVADQVGGGRPGMETDVRLFDAQRFRHDLGKDGFMPLARGVRNRVERHCALDVECHRNLVLGRCTATARFEVRCDADASQPPGALSLRLPFWKAFPVRAFQRVVHHGFEIPGVVGPRVGCLVGHRVARDEILPSQLERVEAVLVGRVVHQPLDGVRDVRAPGAAVGGYRRGVGVGEPRAGIEGGNAVDTADRDGQVAGGDERSERRAVRPEVGAIVEADSEELPVRIERDLASQRQRASLEVAHEGFTARPGPFHRAAELLRREHRVSRAAHAEAAADVLRGDDDFFLDEAADRRELAAHSAEALERNVEGIAPAGGLVCHQAGARLEHVADQALAVHGELADVLRAGKSGCCSLLVAGLEFKCQVAGHFGVQLRCTRRHRGVEARHGGEIPVLDVDQFLGVFRDHRGFRNHHRDRLAHEAHPAHRQHGEGS